jgi:hypothetical protein
VENSKMHQFQISNKRHPKKGYQTGPMFEA